MTIIYHLAPAERWAEALAAGSYAPDSLAGEGFIQCHTSGEYVEAANSEHAGRAELLLLFIEAERLTCELRSEAAAPRLYGPLNVEAVFEVAEYAPGPTGRFGEHDEPLALSMRGDDDLADAVDLALRTMRGFARPWWVAGGWAVDLFLGRKTRPHADLELAVLRADLPDLFAHLAGWELRLVVAGGGFERWAGEPVPAGCHQVWAAQGLDASATLSDFMQGAEMVGFLVEEHDGALWRYRRHLAVVRPVVEYGSSWDELPFVRPEIALLYKSKGTRHKDQRDFEQALPLLDADSRRWLRAALDAVGPGHPWSRQL